jgi:hypothetical protein
MSTLKGREEEGGGEEKGDENGEINSMTVGERD